MNPARLSVALLGLLLGASVPAASEGPEGGAPVFAPKGAAFTFARVEYDSIGGYGESYYFYDGRYWLRWETDYPQAEHNFLHRFRELTTTDPYMDSVTLRLTDARIYDYPFVYMSDVGWMQLTPREITCLRNYLLKGGFVWIDDFWGVAEWQNLEEVFALVFPDRPWQEIPAESSHLLGGLPGGGTAPGPGQGLRLPGTRRGLGASLSRRAARTRRTYAASSTTKAG